MDNDNEDIPLYSERQLALFRRVKDALDDLPVLNASSIPKDESCAICLTPFDAILAGEVPQEGDSEEGVTKVVGCGHLFCRKDLSEWIRNFHGSCPTCRHPFLDLEPYTESDAESDAESSDGEYVPDDDEEEDDEFLFDDYIEVGDFDGYIEAEEMEVDLDDIWGHDDLVEADESDDEVELDIAGFPEENQERSRSTPDADNDVEAVATPHDDLTPHDKDF